MLGVNVFQQTVYFYFYKELCVSVYKNIPVHLHLSAVHLSTGTPDRNEIAGLKLQNRTLCILNIKGHQHKVSCLMSIFFVVEEQSVNVAPVEGSSSLPLKQST